MYGKPTNNYSVFNFSTVYNMMICYCFSFISNKHELPLPYQIMYVK